MAQNLIAHAEAGRSLDSVLAALGRSHPSTSDCAIAATHTMNLFVAIDDPQHQDWVRERALTLARRHSARLMFFDLTSTSGAVDVFEDRADGASGACALDIVEAAVAGLSGEEIEGIARRLASPDVPTVLWWAGKRMLGDPAFAALSASASTIFVDASGACTDASMLAIIAAIGTTHGDARVIDLAYMRLHPWQEMIAHFFDDESVREDLSSLLDVAIESGSDAEALYLLGWLAARLNWEPAAGHRFRRGDASVSYVIHRRGEPRRIRSVRLSTPDSVYATTVSEVDAHVVEVTVSGRHGTRSTLVPLAAVDTVSLAERAIFTPGEDWVCAQTLAIVGRIER